MEERLVEVKSLREYFEEWNQAFFQGALPLPKLRWNSRLQTTAGRFIPDRKNGAIIEVANYLLHEKDGIELIQDTMGHEMIHYWLWLKRKPYGHTPEFYKKMEQMGVSRYNPVPRHRPFKHCYVCLHCDQKIYTRRTIKGAACADCCSAHNGGYYHSKYKLSHQKTDSFEQPSPEIALPKRA